MALINILLNKHYRIQIIFCLILEMFYFGKSQKKKNKFPSKKGVPHNSISKFTVIRHSFPIYNHSFSPLTQSQFAHGSAAPPECTTLLIASVMISLSIFCNFFNAPLVSSSSKNAFNAARSAGVRL